MRLEPERQLNSRKQGLPGKEKSIVKIANEDKKGFEEEGSERVRLEPAEERGARLARRRERYRERRAQQSQEARQAQVDANRSAQQHSRGFATPEARQACLQQDATIHQRSRESGN